MLIKSSAFIGNTKPDSAEQIRYFHNFYGIFSLLSSLGFTIGFDFGAEKQHGSPGIYNVWYSPVAILRYVINEAMSAAARVEYYQDKNGVIIPTNTPHGFQVMGSSINFDYSLTKNSLWRIEVRLLQSKDPMFVKSNGSEDANFSWATSLSLFF